MLPLAGGALIPQFLGILSGRPPQRRPGMEGMGMGGDRPETMMNAMPMPAMGNAGGGAGGPEQPVGGPDGPMNPLPHPFDPKVPPIEAGPPPSMRRGYGGRADGVFGGARGNDLMSARRMQTY